MEFVTVNYSLNQTYNVHKNAFTQIVEKVASNFKELKLTEEMKINIVKGGEDIEFSIDIAVDKNCDASQVILNFSKAIEESVVDMINSKPSNIQIKLIRRF